MNLIFVDESRAVGARMKRALTEQGHVVTARELCQAPPTDDQFDAALVVADSFRSDWLVAPIVEDDLPTLIFAQVLSAGQIITCLDSGVDDVVTSPVRLGEIEARLRGVTRRSQHFGQNVLEVDDLCLDISAQRAWRAGVELRLSHREFTLLETFMRNPRVVLSRELLLESAWDIAYTAESNIVDQYVGHLRRKIDRPFGRENLQTVRGAGYRLDAA